MTNTEKARAALAAEIREQAAELRKEDRSVGIFADTQQADLLDEWANRLEALRLLGESPKLTLIGNVRTEGVVWFGKNPHAHTVIGTEFYSAPPPEGAGT